MSKMNDMAMTIEELRNAATAINDAANWLAQQFGEESVAAEKAEVPAAPAKPTLTLEEVRAVLADKSRTGHTAEIRELLKKYGASKLSLVDPKHYEALLREPTADLAFAGDGNFLCGEWCGFCKAKHECRARAEANLLLAQHDFKLPPLLEDSEIEVILSRVDELVAWANDIKEYALQQAISGKEWTGWKLVEGRSNRRYTSEDAVSKAVEAAGFDPYEKKLLGITAMQKLLGKSHFEELLAAYIEKPQGKPTLVPESDKRPAMNTAKNDFMEEYDNE